MTEFIHVDLGCSNAKRPWPGSTKSIGIDVIAKEGVDHLCKLGFDPIPLPDNSVDVVTAYDLLEHIPFVMTDWHGNQKMPMVFLFNEIYRILKPMGQFFSSTPFYPNRNIFQDPTHIAVWTDETMCYFSGDYYGRHDDWGHTSRFEHINRAIQNDHLDITLCARKDQDGVAENYFVTYPI